MASKFKTPYELYLSVINTPFLTYKQVIHIFALAHFISVSDNIEPHYEFIIINRSTKPNPENPNQTLQVMEIYNVEVALQVENRGVDSIDWLIHSRLVD